MAPTDSRSEDLPEARDNSHVRAENALLRATETSRRVCGWSGKLSLAVQLGLIFVVAWVLGVWGVVVLAVGWCIYGWYMSKAWTRMSVLALRGAVYLLKAIKRGENQ